MHQIWKSYFAISQHPFAHAAWSAVHESSSCRFISDPWLIKILTTLKLLSRTAWWRAVKPEKNRSFCTLKITKFKWSLERRTLNWVVDSNIKKKKNFFERVFQIFEYIWVFLLWYKSNTTLNRVWTRVKGPILGLLLLLSVIPLLSDNSEPIKIELKE